MKRGDADVVRMILRTPATPGTPLLRHVAEAHMFAETNTLVKAASVRGHAAVVEALLDGCFVSLSCAGLEDPRAPAKWRKFAQNRGWAGECEMMGCCYELGSPVLSFDDEERPLFPLTRERLDETALLLLARGADPMHAGGTMHVTPLFMASLNANSRLVGAFLARGADPTRPMADGNTSFKIIEQSLKTDAEYGFAERVAPTLAMLCEAAVEQHRQRSDALALALREISLQAKADGLALAWEALPGLGAREWRRPWASMPGLEDVGFETFAGGTSSPPTKGLP